MVLRRIRSQTMRCFDAPLCSFFMRRHLFPQPYTGTILFVRSFVFPSLSYTLVSHKGISNKVISSRGHVSLTTLAKKLREGERVKRELKSSWILLLERGCRFRMCFVDPVTTKHAALASLCLVVAISRQGSGEDSGFGQIKTRARQFRLGYAESWFWRGGSIKIRPDMEMKHRRNKEVGEGGGEVATTVENRALFRRQGSKTMAAILDGAWLREGGR